MGTINQIANGESGLSARTKMNTALKDVAFTDFESGVVLDDDTFATATDTTLATAESIKEYVTTSIGNAPLTRSYNLGKVNSGTHWLAGFYESQAADVNLTQASTTFNWGTANHPYAARPCIVAGGAGSTDGSDLTLTISGTSITDAGVRTGGDSEVLVADATTASANEFFEPSKKWIGQVVLTLASTGGSAFSFDFNVLWAKYEDFGNVDYICTDFEMIGLCNTTDSGFNISLILHSDQGWVYSAAAFAGYPTGGVICDMNTDHGTEQDVTSGEYFAYKRAGLTQEVNGDGPEGVLIKIDQGSNNTIDFSSAHIGVTVAVGTIT